VVCPTAVAPEHPDSYYNVSDRLSKQPGAWKPDQYSNPNNPRSHYETTGPEILEQTRGRLTHFVAGLGTSGTFMGAGRFLRERAPDVRLVSVQPDSPYHGLEGLKHMATAIVPGIYDPSLADEDLRVSTEQAHDMVRRLAREEGILAGISSGAALETADIVLMADDLGRLPWLVRHSRRALALIRQNIALAVGAKAITLVRLVLALSIQLLFEHLIDHLVPILAGLLAQLLAELLGPAGDRARVVLVQVGEHRRVGQGVEAGLLGAQHRHARDRPAHLGGAAARAAQPRRVAEALDQLLEAPVAGRALVLVDWHRVVYR